MIKRLFNHSILLHLEGPQAWGILINPDKDWEMIKAYLIKHQIKLQYLLVTHANFEFTYRISEIQNETGAKFLSFQSDLLKLQQLPKQATALNICGVKIPHIDRFLDGLKKIDLDGVMLHIQSKENVHEYSVDDVDIMDENTGKP